MRRSVCQDSIFTPAVGSAYAGSMDVTTFRPWIKWAFHVMVAQMRGKETRSTLNLGLEGFGRRMWG